MPSRLPLEVRTDKDAYAPGETVEVSVSAGPAKKKVSFNYFAITLEQQIQYEYDSDPTGDNMHRRTMLDRVPAGQSRSMDARTLARGEKADWTASFVVPEDEPGTTLGDILKVRWVADAVVPFRGRVDAHAERPIQVYAPLARYADRASRHPDLDTDDKAELILELAEPHARPGGQLAGTFRIRPLERVETKEIRVELLRHENVPIDDEADSWAYAAKRELAAGTTLEPGHDLKLSFTLDVPVDVPPTLDIDAGTIVWTVVGTVSRSLRGDLTVSQEITIYDDPRQPAELSKAQEVAATGDDIEDVFSRPPGDEFPPSAPGTP